MMTIQDQVERLKQAEREIRADQARQQLQAQAEQFLASNGIKFRVVQSKRGPGEWNVTFSRKGGGRLKLDFWQDDPPSPTFVLNTLVVTKPSTAEYPGGLESEDYKDDYVEYHRVSVFFTEPEIEWIRNL